MLLYHASKHFYLRDWHDTVFFVCRRKEVPFFATYTEVRRGCGGLRGEDPLKPLKHPWNSTTGANRTGLPSGKRWNHGASSWHHRLALLAPVDGTIVWHYWRQ